MGREKTLHNSEDVRVIAKVAFLFNKQHTQLLGGFPKRLNLFSHLLTVDRYESDVGQYDVLEDLNKL